MSFGQKLNIDSAHALTEREKLLVSIAVEQALLILPEVVGNLMQSQAALYKIGVSFYKDHPEFSEHRDVVAAIMEKVDGENPLMAHEDKVAKAIPLIRKAIALKAKTDNKVVSEPNRDFSNGVL